MLSSNICLHLPFIRYSVYNSNTSVYSVPLCWFVSTARTPTENRLCILHVRERHHEVSLSGRNASNEGYTFWEFSNAMIASRTTRISRSQPSIRPVFSVSYTTSPVMRLPDTAHTDAARR